ncbi:MAG: hypothetical protein WD768_07130 [Phycisphaeraceae bacterium]
MYLFTCSSCGHGEKSPFARVGAVTICVGCKQPIQLRQEDIKRHFRLKTDLDDELFRVAMVQHSSPEEIAVKAEAHHDPAELELHEAVTDEGEHAQEHHDATALAAIAEGRAGRAESERRTDSARRRRAAPPTPPSLSGAELAQHLARARGRKTLMIGGGLGVAAVILLVVVISLMSGNTAPPPTDPNKDTNIAVTDPPKDQGTPVIPVVDPNKDKSTPPPDPTKDKTTVVPPPPPVVRVKAYPMGIDRWQNVNEPYRAVPIAGGVAVLNQTSEVLPDGNRLFRAEVGSKTSGASALATVSLVNDEDRVYARFERPLVLLENQQPRTLELSIPVELARSMATLYCSVQPIDTNVANPRLLDSTLAEVINAGEPAVLKLSGLNNSTFVLKETVFVLQAIDEGGRVQRQWRMKYPHPLDAKTWVKFEAEVLLEGGEQMPKWRVLAAGLPTGAEVTDPPKDKTEPEPPVVRPDERPLKDPIPIRPGRGLFDF